MSRVAVIRMTTSLNVLWATAESFVVSINRKNMLYVNQQQNFRVHFSSVSTEQCHRNCAHFRHKYDSGGWDIWLRRGRCCGGRFSICLRYHNFPLRRRFPRACVCVLGQTQKKFVIEPGEEKEKKKILTKLCRGVIVRGNSKNVQKVRLWKPNYVKQRTLNNSHNIKGKKTPKTLSFWESELWLLSFHQLLSAFHTMSLFFVSACHRRWRQTICCNQPCAWRAESFDSVSNLPTSDTSFAMQMPYSGWCSACLVFCLNWRLHLYGNISANVWMFCLLLLFIHSIGVGCTVHCTACADEIGETDVDGFYMGDNEAIHWQPVTYVLARFKYN